MEQTILSAGIDIGTSTTQLIFSQFRMRNTSGSGRVPKIEIVEKKVLYQSDIYDTPLTSWEEIDGERVKNILKKEYEKAGIRPEDLTTGAVIITGESSRKRNAREVVNALADLAGDFVAVAAGPELEAVLAGQGSGAAALSQRTGKLVANVDIGGGTTNICWFRKGQPVDTACLDIGGRLIRIRNGKAVYISDKMQRFMEKKNIDIKAGDTVDLTDGDTCRKFRRLSDAMVSVLEQSVGLAKPTDDLEFMRIPNVAAGNETPEIITFSGGVADCIYNSYQDRLMFHDIGIFLGESIRASAKFRDHLICGTPETVRATVMGAGNYSMNLSGSTIEYQNCRFPMKNVPVLRIELNEGKPGEIRGQIIRKVRQMREEQDGRDFALAAKGLECPTFAQIENIAEEIAKGMEQELEDGQTLIVILETDMAKALGQALKRRLGREQPLLCIDNITCGYGDYIDIGMPVDAGTALPVIIKTLVFRTEKRSRYDIKDKNAWKNV